MISALVAPAELEGHLLDHPDVADACVVGIPHDYHGEVPLAFVVLSASGKERLKAEGESKAKAVLIKVGVSLPNIVLYLTILGYCSTSPMRKLSTSGSLEA